ncbi:biotin--[acetyl-CoA-carboxylase] ligase [Glacieibacterium sp.]|uniref:biotin--[acetyl-CoA-carboxylase] ligase n=1 Tax=Glacieibacterium sp. TaxID=2860237 RepID=UPI003AFFC890
MAASIVELAEVGSTNDWLAERIDSLADESWVRTDVQTGGRGRRGRPWTSLPGNLFASVITRPQPGEGPSPQLSFVAAVALGRALDRWVAPERLQLKWPNDLLLDGRKVSGILLEGQGGATIIGLGVNLAAHPTDSERPAISLAGAGIAAPSPSEFLDLLARTFTAARADWRDHGFAPIRAAWLERASGLGQRIVARLGHDTLTGTFAGLGDDGALQLELDGGGIRAVHAGEVFAVQG